MKKKKQIPDFERTFENRYYDYAYLVPAMRAALQKDRVEWADLTRLNLTRIVEHLKATHAPNTAHTLVAVIKAFLNLYAEEVSLPCADFARVLSVRRVPSEHVALTADEVRRFEAYVPQSPIERDIKILAMRELLTGARGNDCAVITSANIKDGCVSYVSLKTKKASTLPADSRLAAYVDAPVRKQPYSRMTKNRVLQRICRNCGIDSECKVFVRGRSVTAPKWRLIGFHSLRRTFATNLVSRGVPTAVVSRWMGHSSVAMTERYVCLNMDEVNQKYASAFE